MINACVLQMSLNFNAIFNVIDQIGSNEVVISFQYDDFEPELILLI